jgi:hypothetical protein
LPSSIGSKIGSKEPENRLKLFTGIGSKVMFFLAVVSTGDIVLFSLIVFLVLMGLLAYFLIAFWRGKRKADVSPYTGMPLRYAIEIPYATRDKVNKYLSELRDYDNPIIDWEKAAFCRDTGRIFPHCVTWTGNIKLDWSFLTGRFKGHFVSWGSLSESSRKEIVKAQGSLWGFQTDLSSKNPAPRMIEEEYALIKPGPLYVDPDTKVVVGWREVPDTSLEVLIVKKPLTYQLLSVEKMEKKPPEKSP